MQLVADRYLIIYLFLVPGVRGEHNILHQTSSCQHVSIGAAVNLSLKEKLSIWPLLR